MVASPAGYNSRGTLTRTGLRKASSELAPGRSFQRERLPPPDQMPGHVAGRSRISYLRHSQEPGASGTQYTHKASPPASLQQEGRSADGESGLGPEHPSVDDDGRCVPFLDPISTLPASPRVAISPNSFRGRAWLRLPDRRANSEGLFFRGYVLGVAAMHGRSVCDS